MKLKINESKIRQIVNEEVLKRRLTKSLKESEWPNYTSYLGAELLQLEWQQRLQENNNLDQQPSPEWIAETASAFGLSEAEIAEATELMNSEQLEEGGIKGFMKAFAKPYVNLYKTFTNITQHAANATDPDKDPEGAKVAQTLDNVEDQLPEPEEVIQTAQQSPQELGALMKELIALLRAADQKVNLDDVQPGLEAKVDQAQDAVEQGAEQGLEDLGAGAEGGEEGGAGGEAFVFKGKGGKGLQSFLARGSKEAPRLKGPAMGAVLKHIAGQLKSQGVTVHEGVLDEVQGWIWYGLTESELQERTGTSITIQQILEGAAARGEHGSTQKGDLLSKLDAHLDSLQTAEEVEQFKATAEQGQDPRGEAKFNKGGAKKVRNYYTKFGGVQKIEDKLASLGGEPEEEPAVEEPAAEEAPAAEEPAAEEPAAEEPAAEDAPIEEVPPTVQNTAPEGAPLVKVFKGKGGEGLQSALARSRDKLGIDQRTVSVIIKSVEKWAQANQIRVENITEDVFDSILTELSAKYRARKLQETINKLKNV